MLEGQKAKTEITKKPQMSEAARCHILICIFEYFI